MMLHPRGRLRGLFFVVCLLLLLSTTQLHAHHGPTARQGVLDLNSWRIDLEPRLPLNGQWLFYPHQHLDFQDLARQPIPGTRRLPAPLQDCRSLEQESTRPVIRSLAQLPLPSETYPQRPPAVKEACQATYVLELRRVPEQPLSLMIPQLNSSFRLYWNERYLTGGGDLNSRDPQGVYYGPRRVNLPIGERRGVLILQVANPLDLSAAAVTLQLGDATAIQQDYVSGELWQALIAAIAGIAGILLLLQQIARRRYDTSLWALSLFSFALMLCTLSSGYVVLSWLITDPGWPLLLRLQQMCQNLYLPSLVLWLSLSRPGSFPVILQRLMWLQMLIWAPLQLVLPFSALLVIAPVSAAVNSALAFVLYAYLILGCLRVGRGHWQVLVGPGEQVRPAETARAALAANASVLITLGWVLVCLLHDLLRFRFSGSVLHPLFQSGNWLGWGMMVFIVSQIFLLAVRRARQHAALGETNQQLARRQRLLEQRIQLRTRELQSKVDELDAVASEMNYLSRYDGLTGLWRQSYFLPELQKLLERSHGRPGQVSLILLDLDRYKHISALFGPVAADQAMKDVADLLQQWAQEGRWCSRLEGESFALLLPDTEGDEALHEAQWLRMRISQRSVMVDHLTGDSQRFHITASFGISSCSWHQASLSGLMDTAESALTQAKYQGRNCVVRFNNTLSDAG